MKVLLATDGSDYNTLAAEEFRADLIMVGSHGHGAIERFLLGSVSQAVALHAKCSVEIIRNRSIGQGIK